MITLRSLRHTAALLVTALTAIIQSVSIHSAGTGSLLSQGRWVKVHVDTTSVYHIPYSLLREWGFDRPENIIIAGYGSVERAHALNTAPDDLPVLPVWRDKEGIYFFAEGDTRVTYRGASYATPINTYYNYYSAGSNYFIGEREGMSSPEMDLIPDDGEGKPESDTHTAIRHEIYREEHNAKHGLLSFSRAITDATPRTIGYDITDHCGDATLYYTYGWLHSDNSPQSIGVEFPSGVTEAQVTTDQLIKNTGNHMLFSIRENGRATLTLDPESDRFSTTYTNPSGVFSNLALASTTLVYTRRNRVSEQPMTMYLTAADDGVRLRFGNAGKDLRIWDVTNPRTPIRLTATDRGDGTATATLPQRMSVTKLFAYSSDDTLPVPTLVGAVEPQDLHSLTGVDMLIVTTPATHNAALRLAAAHESIQGLKVAVLNQSDIFNEFSSGSLHPAGLRAFVSRLYNDSERPLRYLLLFGNGSWDTRGTFDKSGTEHLVTYCTEDYAEMGNESRLYTSDLYFGTMSPSIPAALSSLRPKPGVSVGRAPASDSRSAEAFADKCIVYLTDPTRAGAFNHAIVAGGPGDNSQHLTCAEDYAVIVSSLTESPTIHRAHLSLFELDKPPAVSSESYRTYLRMLFAGDSRLFNYTGHSSQDQIANSSLTISSEPRLTYRSMPFTVMASCNTSPIDRPETSLGKSMILHNPGPIAVIGAGNEVYLKYNIRLNEQLLNLFYTPEGGDCIGDLFRIAVSATNTSAAQSINNLCFNFLGDPALPRYLPERTAVVTQIGENTGLTPGQTVTVAPLSPTRIAGTILTADGKVDASYNGRLTLCIYEAPHTERTRVHVSGDEVRELPIDDRLIHSSMIQVTDGRWSSDLTLPATAWAGACRMTLNAVSDSRVIASGGNTRLAIEETEDAVVPSDDATAPVITLTLADGTRSAFVTSSPTLHIEISDDGTGVSLNASSPGMAPRVSIDGSTCPDAAYIFHPDAPGIVAADYTFDNLAEGQHTVTVTARDAVGNSSTESISFTVMSNYATASLSVSAPIVRDDVTFTLTHSLPVEPASQRLVIRDMEGNTILSTDAVSYPYTWDFTTADGTPVPDGTYRASVIIDAHPCYTSTPETKFTIIKR